MKRFISKLTTIAILFVLTSCSTAINTIKLDKNNNTGLYQNKTVILHTNDVHGAIQNYAYIPVLKQYIENEGGTVLLIDAGDFSSGSIYVNNDNTMNAIDLMNDAGYNIVTLGNHEFDIETDDFFNILNSLNANVICSNLLYKENNTNVFDSEIIYKINNLKIGFFALLTPETKTKAIPSHTKNYNIVADEQLYSLAQEEVDKLSSKCDLIICISHLGDNLESANNRSSEIFKNVNGIDFIIDGHSHEIYENIEDNLPIQQTGEDLANIGMIIIDNKTKTIESNKVIAFKDNELINITDVDNEISAKTSEIIENVDYLYNSSFATSLVDLDGKTESVRSIETNLGDLATDAYRWYILNNTEISVDEDHLIALMNGGGLRASIPAGEISRATMNTVHPFGNTLAVVYVSGAQLLEALEASTFCTPKLIGAFPQVSGIEFTIDTTKEYEQGDLYPDSTYYSPNHLNNRVTINSVNGHDFNIDDTYAIATTNFAVVGGDTYYVFSISYNNGQYFDTNVTIDEVMVQYIQQELDFVIDERYSQPQGRITIK